MPILPMGEYVLNVIAVPKVCSQRIVRALLVETFDKDSSYSICDESEDDRPHKYNRDLRAPTRSSAGCSGASRTDKALASSGSIRLA